MPVLPGLRLAEEACSSQKSTLPSSQIERSGVSLQCCNSKLYSLGSSPQQHAASCNTEFQCKAIACSSDTIDTNVCLWRHVCLQACSGNFAGACSSAQRRAMEFATQPTKSCRDHPAGHSDIADRTQISLPVPDITSCSFRQHQSHTVLSKQQCNQRSSQSQDATAVRIASKQDPKREIYAGVHASSCRRGLASKKELFLILLAALLCSAAATCPVSVSYEVSLGESTAGANASTSSVPIFVGKVSVYSNNATIDTWKLGWNFTDGETIQQGANIFTTGLNYLKLAGSTVQLESYSANNTVRPFQFTPVQFLANKATAENPSNPYGVAPLSGVAFNNLLCSKLPLTESSQASSAIAVPGNETLTEPAPLFVEYAPIDFIKQGSNASALASDWSSAASTSTTFLARVSNTGSDAQPVNLSSINLQYWFNGPEDQPDTSDALSLFAMECLDTSLGCSIVSWNITQGLPGVQGARYVLNFGFVNSSGLLLNNTAEASTGQANARGIEVMEVLLQINTRQPFLTSLNSSLDFSYTNTNRTNTPITNTTTIIPRQAEPNTKIPAFLNGKLAWGGAPQKEAMQGPPSPAPAPLSDGSLPTGITCVDTSSGQPDTKLCGLSASYCCYGENNAAVTMTSPQVFPPGPFPIPQAILASNSPSSACETGSTCSPAQTPAPLSATSSTSPGPQEVVGSSPPLAPQPRAPEPSQLAAAMAGGGAPPKSSSSSLALIAGAVAGGLVGVACLALLAYFLARSRRRRNFKDQLASPKASDLGPQQSARDGSQTSSINSHTPLTLTHLGNRLRVSTQTQDVQNGHPKDHSPFGGDSFSPNCRNGPSHRPVIYSTRNGTASSEHPSPFRTHASQRSWETSRTNELTAQGMPAKAKRFQAAHRFVSSAATAPDAAAINLARVSDVTGLTCPAKRLGQQWQAYDDLGLFGERRGNSMPSMRGEYEDASGTFGLDWLDSETGQGGSRSLRRNKSWSGVIIQAPGLEGQQKLKANRAYKRQSSNILPPLGYLPPPISMSSPPANGIDLHVDFETEVRPYLGQCLGTGGFGSVYQAWWRGKKVAVKCLPNLDSKGATPAQFEALIREVELSSKFNSKRLIRVYGACLHDRATACLIMELAEGGNLHQRVYDPRRPRMTLMEALQIIHDVAEGLAYLHPSIIHRDLKPQNILLDAEGHAKIADFGISKVKDPAKTYLTATNDNGTPMYMAPEQFNGSHLDEKVDVYALGCILNECLTRRQPWRNAPNFFQIIVQVAIKGLRPPMDPSCPDTVRRLISKCWAQDSRGRPSCAEVMRMADILLQQERRRERCLASPVANRPPSSIGSDVSRMSLIS